jgi:hypothetical protein
MTVDAAAERGFLCDLLAAVEQSETLPSGVAPLRTVRFSGFRAGGGSIIAPASDPSALARLQMHATHRLAALIIAAALPAACATPEQPASPFAGTWATPERQQIAFRDNTVVINPPNQPPTPMSAQSCDGAFRFGYQHKSRDALLGLTPQQPDLRVKLQAMLVRADYPVAELTCGQGNSTYVMLGARELVVIHRDGDVAGLERLTRL